MLTQQSMRIASYDQGNQLANQILPTTPPILQCRENFHYPSKGQETSVVGHRDLVLIMHSYCLGNRHLTIQKAVNVELMAHDQRLSVDQPCNE